MSIASSGLSALGKLAAVVVLAAAFLFGLAGVVYMSLQGAEVKVPDITGKDFVESEKELALLGLKIKKRADRASAEKPNTVIEQLPKPGDTVKTGQLILVVTSKQRAEGEEAPASLKPGGEEDDTEKIEEMITDKPKKPKANANVTRKKADTTRDVGGDNSNSNSNSNSSDSNSNKKEPGTTNPGDKPKNTAQPVKPGVDPKAKPPKPQ
ncbi:MAG TPA: PASTA domain-containing protein [Pyrinomonadaceae bacterium]|nr:PASTA domain-containing protein [Pyrinomonadaceae bacterium]